MKKISVQNNIEPLFFMLAPIYWLPTLGLYGMGLISTIKIILLVAMGIFMLKDLLITNRRNKITNADIILLLFFILNFFYYISTETSPDALLMSALFVFFYRQGFQSRYRKLKINNFYIYFYIIIFINIIASSFIEQLNFQNPIYILKSNYDYWLDLDVVPRLSSGGYGLGRTAWSFSIILFTCYIFLKLDFSRKKNTKIAKIYMILMFLSQLTTGSKFGICISVVLLFFIFRKTIFKNYVFLYGCFITVTGFIIYVMTHRKIFRLEDGGITTGRYDGFLYAFQVIGDKLPFGWASFPNEKYSLKKYGLNYDSIHNAWLNFFAEYGYVGIGGGLILLVFLLSYLRLKNFKETWVYLGIAIGIINSMVEPGSILSYAYHVFVFWYFIGVLDAKKNKVQNAPRSIYRKNKRQKTKDKRHRNIVTSSSNNRKKLLSNFFSLVVLRGSTYILPLITLPYLVRTLGVEKFGLVMFAQSFTVFFNVFVGYGFDLTATRNISIHRSNLTKVAEIFHSVYIIKILFLLISFLIMSTIIFSFSRFSNDWKLYVVTFGLVIGKAMFPTWFFQGMEKMKFITYLTIISKIIFTILIFVLVKEQSDYILVPILNTLGMIVAGIISVFIVYRTFMLPFIMPSINTLIEELKEGFYIFIASFQTSVVSNSGVFILGMFQDNITVGYYSAIEKLAKAIVGLMSPITQTLYPHISQALSESREKGIKLIYFFGIIVLFITLLVALFLISFDSVIVHLVFGDEFMKYSYLLQLFSIWIFFGVLNNFIGIQYLTGSGKGKIYAKAFTITSVITFLVFILFTKLYSLNAIVIGMIVGSVLLTLIMLIMIKKDNNKKIYLKV